MKIKSSVYQSLLFVFLLICVIAACTPTNSRPKPLGHEQKASATQKATETQLPTLTPTPTETLTPTATETPSPTPAPTEVPEEYPIDIEKLHNFPESYEYMVANLDEFVEAPDGFSDPEALYNWWTEKCIPALGNQEDLEPNVFLDSPSVWPHGFSFSLQKQYSQPLLNEPPIFYFKHKNKVYPVLVLTVTGFDNTNVGTFAFIIHDKSQNGDDGFEAINRLNTGKIIGALYGQIDLGVGDDPNKELQLFLYSDYNWKDYVCEGHTCTWSQMPSGMLFKDFPNKYTLGIGDISTYDD